MNGTGTRGVGVSFITTIVVVVIVIIIFDLLSSHSLNCLLVVLAVHITYHHHRICRRRHRVVEISRLGIVNKKRQICLLISGAIFVFAL